MKHHDNNVSKRGTESEREPNPGTTERILAAARVCLERGDIATTTVEDVLAEAGVSRSTFYRYFSGLDAIVARIAVAEGRALLVRGVEFASSRGGFVDQLTSALVHAVKHSPESAWVSRLTKAEVTVQTTRAVLELEPAALAHVGSALHPLLDLGRQSGELRVDLAFDEITEWLLRNVWSLQTAPGPKLWSEQEMSRYVREFVLPGILAKPANAGLEEVMATLRRIEGKLGTAGE